jgi:hypothetical protein
MPRARCLGVEVVVDVALNGGELLQGCHSREAQDPPSRRRKLRCEFSTGLFAQREREARVTTNDLVSARLRSDHIKSNQVDVRIGLKADIREEGWSTLRLALNQL